MDRSGVISDYIKTEIMRNKNARLDPGMDLLAAGILDSLGILQLVAFLDDKLGIRVPDEDVVYENFNSVNALVEYLSKF